MVRIKYTESGDALHSDWFTLGPNYIVKAIISTKTNSYQIIEFNSELVLDGFCNNLRQCKDEVRKHLVELGVVFDGEIRMKQ